MNEVIEEAKAEYLQAKERLIKALATTPDDRINWSPSPTSRTPIRDAGRNHASGRSYARSFRTDPLYSEHLWGSRLVHVELSGHGSR